MRRFPNTRAEPFRVPTPDGVDADSEDGFFVVKNHGFREINVVVSTEGGWDLVSVMTRGSSPTWDEMCLVREIFFRDDETAIQYSVPKPERISTHKFALHWWRPHTLELPRPPRELIAGDAPPPAPLVKLH